MNSITALIKHAERIATTQACWLDDTTGRTEALALYGHDRAHIGATAWANACRQLLHWPRHWRPELQMQTTRQIDLVLKTLKQGNGDHGHRNQIIDGLTVRAGLVIGAPVPCGTTGCTTGRIMAGEARCAGCGTSWDTHTERRCEACQTFLGLDTPNTQKRCTACHSTQSGETSCVGSRRHRWLTRNDGTEPTCIHCHRSQDAVSGSYLQAGTNADR